jgi:hypothetical protein
VKFLVENRAEGGTFEALELATECGHLEVVRWLNEHDVQLTDPRY